MVSTVTRFSLIMYFANGNHTKSEKYLSQLRDTFPEDFWRSAGLVKDDMSALELGRWLEEEMQDHRSIQSRYHTYSISLLPGADLKILTSMCEQQNWKTHSKFHISV